MKSNIVYSDMICPICHKKFPIPRKKNKQRERHHIKDMWCPFCLQEVKMIEKRYFEFDEEVVV